jgi:oligo-1,6-glucosidase
MNQKVLSHYDLLTVGEAAGVTLEEAPKYAGNHGTELSMVFHFEHMGIVPESDFVIGKWDVGHPRMKDVRAILNKWQLGLEGKAWGSLYWDNHDQPRVVSRFGNDSKPWRVISAKMLGTCLHMMKGTPYIYQGEEIGMTNTHFETIEDCRDIEEINAYRQFVTEQHAISKETMLECFNTMGRDNARTPMQWNTTKNAGFTEGTPWIDVNPNYKEINVEAALADKDSIFYYYQKLIRLRHENPIIVYGVFQPLMMDSDTVYAYERVLDDKTLVVACNWTAENQACTLFDDLRGEDLISNYSEHVKGMLQPYEARVMFR